MDANAYANDDDDENGQRERDVEWGRKGERGRRGGVSAKWMLSRFGYLFGPLRFPRFHHSPSLDYRLWPKWQHNCGSCSFRWPEMRLRLSEVKPRTGPKLLAKIANRQSAIANCTLSSFQFNLSGNCLAQVKG